MQGNRGCAYLYKESRADLECYFPIPPCFVLKNALSLIYIDSK